MDDECKKWDGNKPKLAGIALLPSIDLMEKAVKRNEMGAKRYGRDNWKNGTSQRYRDALMRHLIDYLRGEVDDEEGLTHLDAVMWNSMACHELDKIEQKISERSFK